MKLTNKRSNGKNYLLAFTLAALTCTYVQFNIPLLHRDWILLLFSALILVVHNATPWKMKGYKYFFLYFCVLLLNYITGDSYFSSFPKLICEITVLYVSVSFFDLANTNNLKLQRLLLFTFIGGMIITAIGTYIAEQSSPGVLRKVQSEILNNGESATLYAFSKIGMTNYALPHALPAILPINILIIKEKIIPISIKFINLITLISSLAIIFYSGATTPVLISIATLIIALFIRPGNINKNITQILFLLLIILILLYSKEYIAEFFLYISDRVNIIGGSHSLTERFKELHDFILTGDTNGDMEDRMEHYNSTTSIINSNILWGINDDSYGGHSAILDRIAVLGLLGFIPFTCFLASQIIYFFKHLTPKYQATYIICICTALMSILTKNMFSREFCIITFLIVPLSLSFLQNFNYNKK